MDRILCAVTFSPLSQRVVDWAASLAIPHGAEVRLFHALPHPGDRASTTSEADSERALEQLFALAQQVPNRPRISAAVAEGDAVTESLRHARLAKAELIAVGMHAPDGSVSPLLARLASEAPCPVLVAVGERSRSSRDYSELVTSGRACVEIVRLASACNADLIVMGIDAGQTRRQEFGETSSCVMQFARRSVLLVPERLFRARPIRRRDLRKRIVTLHRSE